MTLHLQAANSDLIRLVARLRMSRRHGEPTIIDRTTMTLTVPESFVFFPKIVVGNAFGRFGERIIRVNRFRGEHDLPAWFRPKEKANHIAFHSAYGDAVYFEVSINTSARENDHPFVQTLLPHVQSIPQEVSLFEQT